MVGGPRLAARAAGALTLAAAPLALTRGLGAAALPWWLSTPALLFAGFVAVACLSMGVFIGWRGRSALLVAVGAAGAAAGAALCLAYGRMLLGPGSPG